MSPHTRDTATHPQPEPHGWLGTETLKTHAGDFVFKNGYPAGDTAQRLRDLQTLNRATEVYLTQLMPVSEIALREGLRVMGVDMHDLVGILGNSFGPSGRTTSAAGGQSRQDHRRPHRHRNQYSSEG